MRPPPCRGLTDSILTDLTFRCRHVAAHAAPGATDGRRGFRHTRVRHPEAFWPCGSSPCEQSLARVRRNSFLPWFHFLPPFAPSVVTRPRSMVPVLPTLVCPWLACATMAALTAAGHLTMSFPGSYPAFTPSPLPDILSPTTRTSPTTANACDRCWSSLITARLRQYSARVADSDPPCPGTADDLRKPPFMVLPSTGDSEW